MRILAIETVATTGSVAALDDERLLAELPLDPQRRSAQSLAPGIHQLLAGVGWRPADVELVAVASGPGSFTGLRIGVTTAKALAYAVGCQVIGVNTTEAIAARVPADVERMSVIIDAQRGELFVADFRRADDGQLAGRDTTRLVPGEVWLAERDPNAWVTGSALKTMAKRLAADAKIVAEAHWSPTAAAVGQVGARAYAAGERSDVFGLAPVYFRRTAAEEQWERKQAQ